jgi:hypothetical protein
MPSSKGKVNISNRFKSLSDILNVLHLGLNLFYLFQNEDCKNVKKTKMYTFINASKHFYSCRGERVNQTANSSFN